MGMPPSMLEEVLGADELAEFEALETLTWQVGPYRQDLHAAQVAGAFSGQWRPLRDELDRRREQALDYSDRQAAALRQLAGMLPRLDTSKSNNG